jgi:hypothetical protein
LVGTVDIVNRIMMSITFLQMNVISFLKKLSLFLAFLGAAFLYSCGGERTPLLPNITGSAGQVVVVINDPVWESEAGKQLGRILSSEHRALPQREPLFDLVRIGHASFTNLFKTHRNIVVVNISGQYTESRMNIRRNVFARPQVLIEINAPDTERLYSFLVNHEERIVGELQNTEIARITEYNRLYEKGEIREELNAKFDLSLIFPPGYSIFIDTTDFAWIGFHPVAQERMQGVFIYQYDYRDPDTFTPESLIVRRNEFLRQYVAGPREGSFMTTEMNLSPIFTEFMENGRYFAELRGLWKVQNDFMGGPFISRTTLDEERNRVITVEGFVFAPGEKKRNLLRQVEGIINTFEISE